jgi:predicted amidohydrolase
MTSMSSYRQIKHPPTDPVDLLAYLYDELDADLFKNPLGLYEHLYEDPRFEETAARVRDEAEADGTTSHAHRVVNRHGLNSMTALACLVGLDRALESVTDGGGVSPPPGLEHVSWRLRRTGVLNTPALAGAVLPACVRADPPASPVAESTRDILTSVVRVTPDVWKKTELIRVPALHDFDADEIEVSLAVACVPMADDFRELAISRRNPAFYEIGANDTPAMRKRIETLLPRLDSCGAQIAVLPELTTTPKLVELWSAIIAANPRPPSSKLRWLFAGTGAFPSGNREPFNRATLLSRRGGTTIATQDKRFPFVLTDTQIGEWKLERLGDGPLAELIERGKKFHLLESTLGRLVVLICEDLGRSFDTGPDVRALGVSHIVAPVFSKPVVQYFWEHQRARDYVAHGGVTTIVANSVAVGREQQRRSKSKRKPVGTALAVTHSGEFAVGSAERADEILLFAVADDGSSVTVTTF